jgi:hypothetical protein
LHTQAVDPLTWASLPLIFVVFIFLLSSSVSVRILPPLFISSNPFCPVVFFISEPALADGGLDRRLGVVWAEARGSSLVFFSFFFFHFLCLFLSNLSLLLAVSPSSRSDVPTREGGGVCDGADPSWLHGGSVVILVLG